MKLLKTLTLLFATSLLSLQAMAQSAEPAEVAENCYQAVLQSDYDGVKKCLSKRIVPYVDVAKTKIENPQMKFQKKIALVTLGMITYDVEQTKYADDGKSVVLYVNAQFVDQAITPQISLIIENGEWKIDDVLNKEELMKQLDFLAAFIK